LNITEVPAYALGSGGKRRPAGFIVPKFVAEDELCQYLADLFHESATRSNGDVFEIAQTPFVTTHGSEKMNPIRLVAIALIVLGVLGLAYGGFSYTKDTTVVKLGPIELSAKEKQTVNVPMWAGIGAIVVGGLLLVLGSKKR
jgi:hypothetical protein